jgi:hypothetical protein
MPRSRPSHRLEATMATRDLGFFWRGMQSILLDLEICDQLIDTLDRQQISNQPAQLLIVLDFPVYL